MSSEPPAKRARVGLDEAVEATAVTRSLPYYATKLARHGLPSELMENPQPANHAMKAIRDQHSLDFSPLLNTSSYVNVVFEEQEEEVAKMGMRVNLADQTVYTQSFDLHNRTLGMVAKLWHCPEPEDWQEHHTFAGACTVGSTEACLLSGLAHKFRWREWYLRRTPGATKSSVRAVLPNVVISTQFQAAWEKFFKYMDVEPKFVSPSLSSFKLTAAGVEAAIDERTLMVVCIMGNHYGGQYDPVWEINDVVERVNQEKGFQVGIHVDAASGGFVAPFQELPAWDFRLKNVLSISASGHKFGESCAGTGWVVFRQRRDLSEHIAISVSYLGGQGESYTLNFSRPATGVYVQFYKFLRHGRLGYQNLTDNMMATSKYIRDQMKEMKAGNGKKVFKLLDDGDTACLPVVTAMIDKEAGLPYDDIDLQHVLAMEHWYVSGYAQNFHDPVTEEKLPLFSDSPLDATMFRVVVKSNLTHAMAENLVECMKRSIDFLDAHGKGFEKIHKNQTKHKGHSAC